MQMMVDDSSIDLTYMCWDNKPLELSVAAEEILRQLDGRGEEDDLRSKAVRQRYTSLSEEVGKAMRGERPREYDMDDYYDDQYDWDC